MGPTTLATWREVALILLLIEGIVISAIPLFVLRYLTRLLRYLTRWLRRFTPQLSPVLRGISEQMNVVEDRTKTISRRIAEPFIWTQATAHGIRAGLIFFFGRR